MGRFFETVYITTENVMWLHLDQSTEYIVVSHTMERLVPQLLRLLQHIGPLHCWDLLISTQIAGKCTDFLYKFCKFSRGTTQTPPWSSPDLGPNWIQTNDSKLVNFLVQQQTFRFKFAAHKCKSLPVLWPNVQPLSVPTGYQSLQHSSPLRWLEGQSSRLHTLSPCPGNFTTVVMPLDHTVSNDDDKCRQQDRKVKLVRQHALSTSRNNTTSGLSQSCTLPSPTIAFLSHSISVRV